MTLAKEAIYWLCRLEEARFLVYHAHISGDSNLVGTATALISEAVDRLHNLHTDYSDTGILDEWKCPLCEVRKLTAW